ncbi:MAG TPA: hypothetical protein VG317_13625 [Pseudonocardiaceae bacterium]|nr:hypothetical protein [Pseudonocardiaceae bacterium]
MEAPAEHRSEWDTGAQRIVNQLAYRYDGLFDRDRIDGLFHDSYERLAETARVTIFLPTLAELAPAGVQSSS